MLFIIVGMLIHIRTMLLNCLLRYRGGPIPMLGEEIKRLDTKYY